MHVQRCPWLLRADRRGSVCRGGPGSTHGCRSWWCARHCGLAIPGWYVCLPLAPAGGWQTSVGSCGSSPALPSQRPPRPGEPLFERSSRRGGGAPVAHGLPHPRRQIAGMQAAARCPHHGNSPLHAGPHHPHGSCHQSCSRLRGWA
jgi:hypothetical protein